jgi:hypothetical protein
MSRNKRFFPSFEYNMFYVLYTFATYLLTLPRMMYVRPGLTSSCLIFEVQEFFLFGSPAYSLIRPPIKNY